MIIIVDFIKELLIVPYTPSSEKMNGTAYYVYMRYFRCDLGCCTDKDCTDNDCDCTKNRITSSLIPDDKVEDYITGDWNERLISVSNYQSSNIWVVISANPDNRDSNLEFTVYTDEEKANLDFFTNDAKYKSIKKFEIPFKESYVKSAIKKK